MHRVALHKVTFAVVQHETVQNVLIGVGIEHTAEQTQQENRRDKMDAVPFGGSEGQCAADENGRSGVAALDKQAASDFRSANFGGRGHLLYRLITWPGA